VASARSNAKPYPAVAWLPSEGGNKHRKDTQPFYARRFAGSVTQVTLHGEERALFRPKVLGAWAEHFIFAVRLRDSKTKTTLVFEINSIACAILPCSGCELSASAGLGWPARLP